MAQGKKANTSCNNNPGVLALTKGLSVLYFTLFEFWKLTKTPFYHTQLTQVAIPLIKFIIYCTLLLLVTIWNSKLIFLEKIAFLITNTYDLHICIFLFLSHMRSWWGGPHTHAHTHRIYGMINWDGAYGISSTERISVTTCSLMSWYLNFFWIPSTGRNKSE